MKDNKQLLSQHLVLFLLSKIFEKMFVSVPHQIDSSIYYLVGVLQFREFFSSCLFVGECFANFKADVDSHLIFGQFYLIYSNYAKNIIC